MNTTFKYFLFITIYSLTPKFYTSDLNNLKLKPAKNINLLYTFNIGFKVIKSIKEIVGTFERCSLQQIWNENEITKKYNYSIYHYHLSRYSIYIYYSWNNTFAKDYKLYHSNPCRYLPYCYTIKRKKLSRNLYLPKIPRRNQFA